MNYFDYAVLAVPGLSMLWSLLRGLVRELVSLIGWVSAFAIAGVFGGQVAKMLPLDLGPLLSGLIGFITAFICVLVASGFVGLVVSKLVNAAGLGFMDRLLGALFGIVRGLVMVLLLVLLGGLTPLQTHAMWREAVLSVPLETAVLAIRPMLPEGMKQQLKYR